MPDMHPTQLARPTRAASGSSDHVAAVQVTNLSKSYGDRTGGRRHYPAHRAR